MPEGEHPNPSPPVRAVDHASAAESRLQARRQMLRMGAVGLPMMLTMRASAQSVVSQLQCTIEIPRNYNALIDADGAVWMVRANLSQVDVLTDETVARLQQRAERRGFVFPPGSASAEFRPDPSSCRGDDDDYDYDDDDDDDDDRGSRGLGRCGGNRGRGVGNECDDDDDDDDDEDDVSCYYNLVQFGRRDSFAAEEVFDLNGNIYATEERQLFLELAQAYMRDNPAGTEFPAISCIISVMAYTGA